MDQPCPAELSSAFHGSGAEGMLDIFKKPVEGAQKDGIFGFGAGAAA